MRAPAMTDLRAALNACKPELIARYEDAIRSLFKGMVELHGPSLQGIGNCWQYARAWSNGVAYFAKAVERDWRNAPTVYALDDAKLAKAAEKYAEAAIASWQAKIESKLGDLESAEVARLDGTSFRITGTRKSRRVEINQRMIVNISAQGTPYNQWPALIYVEGKKTSEAAYKKL